MDVRRLGFALLAGAALLCGAASPPPEPVRCTCRDGNACSHWLKSPVPPPADPCSCPTCRANQDTCPKTYPSDWNPACIGNGRMECFLRRHAASWKLWCSEEMGRCECPGDDSASCPACGPGGKPRDPARLEALRKQVAVERKVFPSDLKLVVVQSPHFVLATDIPSIKVLTQNGSRREVTTHELAHLYIQRAELAYKDFVRTFGDDIRTSRPIALFLNKRRRDSERVQSAYFGRPNAGLVYGMRGSTTPPISGGIAEAGVAACLEMQTSDESLHVTMRTSIGDVLMSLWHSTNATPSHLPMWAMVGAGHWLGRVPAALSEKAAFIGGEGNAPNDDGHDWLKRVAKEFGKGELPHIDSFLGFTTLSQMDLPAHMRAWGLFALWLDDDRDRFVKLLKLIRDGKNQREAVQQVWGVSTDEFDQRWRDRVTGKRKSLGEEKEKPAEPAGAGASRGGLADLARENDPRTVADRIKARKTIDDPADAAALLALLDRDVDQITERVVLTLAREKDEDVRGFLRGDALAKSRGRVRAGLVRILGLAKDADAGESVAALLADPDPDVRAQAALAVGRMRRAESIPALRPLLAAREDDVALAAMDALAMFGEAAQDEWMRVAPRLEDPHRPVRTAAAECLGALGTMEAVDALIARMDKEDGRVRMDIRQALRDLVRDDLGVEPSRWKKWWEAEKLRNPGVLPARPAEKPKPDPNARYAQDQPKFYGVEIFSKRLAFVIDVSSSMCDRVTVDPSWLHQEGRTYGSSAQKYDLAVAEIAAALKTVDPRLEFGVITFRTEVRTWRERLVTAGTGMVDQALQYLAAQHPVPLADAGDPSKQKTNLADALRLALGIRPGTSGRPSDEAADEVYVLTDGQPTAGDLTDDDVLLSWFRERNRLARLRLHVVTFETIDTDLAFLRALAQAGGGAFVAIPTARR